MGLVVPLMRWMELFRPADYSQEATKLGNIKFVYEEFVVHCKEDQDLFEVKFPGLRNQYTKLFKAVRVARLSRGEVMLRRRQGS